MSSAEAAVHLHHVCSIARSNAVQLTKLQVALPVACKEDDQQELAVQMCNDLLVAPQQPGKTDAPPAAAQPLLTACAAQATPCGEHSQLCMFARYKALRTFMVVLPDAIPLYQSYGVAKMLAAVTKCGIRSTSRTLARPSPHSYVQHFLRFWDALQRVEELHVCMNVHHSADLQQRVAAAAKGLPALRLVQLVEASSDNLAPEIVDQFSAQLPDALIVRCRDGKPDLTILRVASEAV